MSTDPRQEPTTAARVIPANEEMGNLEHTLQSLAEAVTMLEERLSPVSSPGEQAVMRNETEKMPDDNFSPLVKQLKQLNSKADFQVRRIIGLADQLEI